MRKSPNLYLPVIVIVIAIAAGACVDRTMPDLAAGTESVYNREPTLGEIEAHPVGSGDAIEVALRRQIKRATERCDGLGPGDGDCGRPFQNYELSAQRRD
jgi:hypothetical protein